MDPLITPQLRIPPTEGTGFARVWYLFFDSITTLGNYLLGLVPNTVFGGSTLTTLGALTKVTAPGVIGESAVKDDGTNVTVAGRVVKVTGTRPTVYLLNTGGTSPIRLEQAANDSGQLTMNLSFDGTNWNFDDVSKDGWILQCFQSRTLIYKATASANPATLVAVAEINAAGEYIIGANRVVSTRKAALTATVAAGNAAGVAYLQADAATWVTLMNRNKTRIDELEARLNVATGHGLIAT